MSTNSAVRSKKQSRLFSILFRALATAALGALFGTGCGEVEYGLPASPTAAQLRAIAALNEVAARTALAGAGQTDAATLSGVHALVAALPDTALLEPTSRGTTRARPVLADPSCASGSPSSGFVYSECALDGDTLSGQVALSPTRVSYELLVESMTDPKTASLQGELAIQGGRIAGILDFSSGSESVVYDSASGSGTSVFSERSRTWVHWDVAVSKSPACISAGTVRVQVQSDGGERNARFTFSGCDQVAVENDL